MHKILIFEHDIVGENLLRLVPMGTHEWDNYINSEDVERIISADGLHTLDKKGIFVKNPISLEMREVDNWFRSNYMLLAKKI